MRNEGSNTAAGPSRLDGLARYVPGVALFRGYRRQWLIPDLTAGVSVCVIMIPSVIAYAGLMGLPPQQGLYAALIPPIVYALFGSSRQMIVGPDIAITLLVANAVMPLAAGNPARAASLAAVIALLSGLLLFLGSRARFGAVADLLSKPVLAGYMTGAALILIASQLGNLFGVRLESTDFFPRLAELLGKLNMTHVPTLLLGLGLLALAVILRRSAPRVPAALAVCIAAFAASVVFKLEERGVAVVGQFPGGLPAFSWPATNWGDIHALLPAAIGIAVLTYTEGILLARAFAARNKYEVNPNQELTALGLADMATGLFQGFSVTGSQARTSINDSSGAKTQLSGLVAAATLAVFLLFLTPLLTRLPRVALAAILIYAGVGLVEFNVIARIYRRYPRSSVLAALTTLSVLVAGVVPGILFGVALSLIAVIQRLSRPADGVLSEVPGHGFHDLGDPSKVQTIPGLTAYRFYAPLLFSNSSYFLSRVRNLISSSPTPIHWFLLDAQAITDMDATAAELLQQLHREFREQGIAVKIAHANRPFRDALERSGLARAIGQDSVFNSVHECVEKFRQQLPLKSG